jgi:hypothetical protein
MDPPQHVCHQPQHQPTAGRVSDTLVQGLKLRIACVQQAALVCKASILLHQGPNDVFFPSSMFLWTDMMFSSTPHA